MRVLTILVVMVSLGSACSPPDPGTEPDASVGDADAGSDDGGTAEEDAGASNDAGVDAGAADSDAGDGDAGVSDDAGHANDAGDDAGAADIDAGSEDPCASANGGCDVLTECTIFEEQVSCGACPTGYTGDGMSGCVDVDECAAADDVCGATAFCANTPGAYNCFEPPNGVVLFDPRMTAAVGDTDATPQLRPCPPGEVAIGYTLRMHAAVSNVTVASAMCSPLTLSGAGPADYVLTTTPPSFTSTDDRVCPENEVVVGMGVAANPDLESMTVECAPISVRFDAESGFTIVTGTPHSLPRFPSETSPDINASVTCPEGTVGAGQTPYGGQWLFAFAMRCVRPDMRFDVPSISFGAESDAPFVGVTDSSPEYRDVCPSGQIVTGVQLESQKRSFAVECGEPLFDLPLRVAVTPGATLSYHGALSPRFALRCPWDTGLSQLELATFSGAIIRLDMGCSPFTAADTTPAWTVSVDAPAPGPRWGQLAATPDKVTACPAGTVAVGVQSSMTTQPNSYVTLTHLGLVCAAPLP